jgi:hypothetical protein
VGDAGVDGGRMGEGAQPNVTLTRSEKKAGPAEVEKRIVV